MTVLRGGIGVRALGSRRPECRGAETRARATGRNNVMAVILLVLLLAIILGGLGFAIHVLWWIALAVLVLWLVGFAVRVGEGTSRSRWYRW
jgi:membrane protein YdbS with pleckstrin-like domain